MSKRKTTEEFIEEAKQIHGDKYDYSSVEYKNNKTKVKIICPEHGEFCQYTNSHLMGKGCNECAQIKKREKFQLSKEEFIEKAKEIHGDKYSYDLVEYVNNKTKVKIICSEHGEFYQRPDSHLKGHGCPSCKSSKGEIEIIKILEKYNIKYEKEKTFEECIWKGRLRFDFYLPDYDLCIEFDGIQHFESIDFFGGEKALEENKIKDEIKNDFCGERLIRISNLEEIEMKIKNLV